MQYYIRSNSRTLGPFDETQVRNLLEQGRYDDSVEVSVDLAEWLSPGDCSAFREFLRKHPLKHHPDDGGGKPVVVVGPPVKRRDYSVYYFLSFCLVVLASFVTALCWINKDSAIIDKPQPPDIIMQPRS